MEGWWREGLMSERKSGSRWDQDIEVQGGIGDPILGRDEGDVCRAQGRSKV